jgi:hypothetical protein
MKASGASFIAALDTSPLALLLTNYAIKFGPVLNLGLANFYWGLLRNVYLLDPEHAR